MGHLVEEALRSIYMEPVKSVRGHGACVAIVAGLGGATPPALAGWLEWVAVSYHY